MNSFTHYDERSGDKYVIFFDNVGEFTHALRYVDKVGIDAIPYERLCDLPAVVQSAVEHQLCQKTK